MPNGKCILNELDFETHIERMGDRDLLEFVARQNYETSIRCEKHDNRITTLENQQRRMAGLTGGIAGMVSSIIVGIINYFIRN